MNQDPYSMTYTKMKTNMTNLIYDAIETHFQKVTNKICNVKICHIA